jgi:hypothetical protein
VLSALLNPDDDNKSPYRYINQIGNTGHIQSVYLDVYHKDVHDFLNVKGIGHGSEN